MILNVALCVKSSKQRNFTASLEKLVKKISLNSKVLLTTGFIRNLLIQDDINVSIDWYQGRKIMLIVMTINERWLATLIVIVTPSSSPSSSSSTLINHRHYHPTCIKNMTETHWMMGTKFYEIWLIFYVKWIY